MIVILVILKNTNKIPNFIGSSRKIFVNRFNHIIYNGKLVKQDYIRKNKSILYYQNIVNFDKILDEDYKAVLDKLSIVTYDLILLRDYLSSAVKKRGKSLIIADINNNKFYEKLYNCFEDEYKEKIDFIIIL